MGDEISIQTTPSLPAWENHTTRALPGTEDVTTKALAPEQKDTLSKIGDLETQQTKIADSQLAADTAANTVHVETAREMADAATKLSNERDAAINDTDGQIALWRSKLRAANDKYMTAPMPSLFGNSTTGQNVLKTLGLIAASAGQARYTTAMLRAGHDPGQGNAVDDIINRDFTEQRENIAKLKDNALMAASGVKDAEEARRIMLANIDVKQAAVYDRIAKIQAARIASTTGQPLVNVKHDQAVADATENAVKYRLSAVSGLTQEVTKKFGGTQERITRAPTEEKGGGQAQVRQNKVYNDVATALDAAKEIDPEAITPDVLSKIQANQTEAEGAEHTGKVPVVGAAVVNAGREAGVIARGPLQDVPDKAAKSWALLQRLATTVADARQSTGEGPAQDYYGKVLPQPGDSKEIVRGKVEQLRKDAATFGAIQDPNEVGAQRIAARNAGAPVKAIPNAVTTPSTPTPANVNNTPKAETDRDRAIRLLKGNPALPGAAAVMKKFGIKPEELANGG